MHFLWALSKETMNWISEPSWILEPTVRNWSGLLAWNSYWKSVLPRANPNRFSGSSWSSPEFQTVASLVGPESRTDWTTRTKVKSVRTNSNHQNFGPVRTFTLLILKSDTKVWLDPLVIECVQPIMLEEIKSSSSIQLSSLSRRLHTRRPP